MGVDVGKNHRHLSVRVLSRDTYYLTLPVGCDFKGFVEFASVPGKYTTKNCSFLKRLYFALAAVSLARCISASMSSNPSADNLTLVGIPAESQPLNS